MQALLDGVTAAFYNAFFTAGPICAFALFDRPVRHLSTLMDFPQMYNRRPALTTRVFWKTGILWAISHAVVGPPAPLRPALVLSQLTTFSGLMPQDQPQHHCCVRAQQAASPPCHALDHLRW